MPDSTPLPRNRKLSLLEGRPQLQHCPRCHLRLPSYENLPSMFRRQNSTSSEEEEWDDFCPDISMPQESSRFHLRPWSQRRHSCLCPRDAFGQAINDDKFSRQEASMMGASATCAFGHQPSQCDCQDILPRENLEGRYGLVEEPQEIKCLGNSARKAVNKSADTPLHVLEAGAVAEGNGFSTGAH